jgi:hypothetical protein
LVLLFSVLVVTGCKVEPVQAFYGVYADACAVVSWKERESLAVLILPLDLVEGYAGYTQLETGMALEHLIGLPAIQTWESTSQALSQARDLTTTLACTTTAKSRDEVDDQSRVEALVGGAGYLRKTGLADTLIAITGFSDPFSLLSGIRQVSVYDLRAAFTLPKAIDWKYVESYLNLYVEEVLRYQRRSKEA